jgi:hypothetical protein
MAHPKTANFFSDPSFIEKTMRLYCMDDETREKLIKEDPRLVEILKVTAEIELDDNSKSHDFR